MGKRYNIKDLSFSFPKHTIKIDIFDIPILVDMSKIKFNNNEELKVGLFGMDDVFAYQYEQIKLFNQVKWNFRYINTEDKIYDNFSKTFLEYHNMKNLDELLDVFDELDIYKFNKHVSKIIAIMINEFRRRLYSSLKLDIKPPVIHHNSKTENKMSENVKEYLQYTESYIEIQTLKEMNPTVFFPENINKAISDWSLREIELHMSYTTIKNRTQSVENKETSRIMDTKDK